MSHTQVQWARGTGAQVAAYTGPSGELVLNTDDWSLQAQDGVTAGGWVVRPRRNVRTVTATGTQSVNVTDDLIAWQPTTPAATTFTLPSSPRVGEAHSFKYLASSGSFTLTVAAPAGQTVDGAASAGLGVLYAGQCRVRLHREQPMDHRMNHMARFATVLGLALLWAVPAGAQLYIPGVTCPTGQAMTGYTPQTGIVCATVSGGGGNSIGQNRLINANMHIDQANEGGTVTLASGTPAYIVDGVKAEFHSSGNTTNATVSCARAADAPTGYTFSLKCTVGTAASAVSSGDFLIVLIPIEANDIQDALLGTASAQSICVQWQSKISIGSYVAGWSLQNFAQTRSYPATVLAAASGTWTLNQACITGDTGGTWVTNGGNGGAYLVLSFAAGSTFQGIAATWDGGNFYTTSSGSNSLLTTAGASFEITNVKLEISSAVTPFQMLPFERELARCLRYYEKSWDIGTAVAASTRNGAVVFESGYYNGSIFVGANGSIPFKVQKRADPTISYWDVAGHANKLSAYVERHRDRQRLGLADLQRRHERHPGHRRQCRPEFRHADLRSFRRRQPALSGAQGE